MEETCQQTQEEQIIMLFKKLNEFPAAQKMGR